MFNLITAHPYITSAVAAWIFNNILTALVGNLPAPTKNSTVQYTYWFKVANAVVFNVQRAKSTKIEDSPNWQPALEKYLADIELKKSRIGKPNGSSTS